MKRSGRFQIPDLAGTLFLLVLLAAFSGAFTFALDEINKNLGGTGQLVASLFFPLILLAIVANIWPDGGRGR